MQALLFDCDGVLADTERDGHRVAFNRAFAALGLDTRWSVERYGDLLKTAGGKERMRRHFDETAWPVTPGEREDLIAELHKTKTTLFMDIVSGGELPLRAGVARLVDEAIAAAIKIAVCSTSNERAVRAIIDQLVQDRSRHVALFAGDVVPKKKPDPAIYLLAARSLGVAPARCVVIEDSNNGLRAALAAGMHCIITMSSYTANEDFSGAAKVVPELGDRPNVALSLDDCRLLTERQTPGSDGAMNDILVSRDPACNKR
jgi:HAD superfamily hydrolase (TIGR01509 family)